MDRNRAPPGLHESPIEAAERHVRLGRERIQRQRERIAVLAADGHSRAHHVATELLQTLMQSQSAIERHLARLLAEGRPK